MPRVKFCAIASYSGEDRDHPVTNLLEDEVSKKKWLCKRGDPFCSVVLQLTHSVQIETVTVGAHAAALVEVLVGRSENSHSFEILVPGVNFLNMQESRRSECLDRVRTFMKEHFAEGVRDQKWDRVRVMCKQPYNRHLSYGLSFVHVFESGGRQPSVRSPPISLHILDECSSDEEQFKPGVLFSTYMQRKDAGYGEGTSSAESQIRRATSQALKNIPGTSTQLVKIPRANKDEYIKDKASTSQADGGNKRDRNNVMYENDDGKPNAKIDRIVRCFEESKKLATEKNKEESMKRERKTSRDASKAPEKRQSKEDSDKREGKTSKVESEKREGRTSKVESEKREGITSKVESEKREGKTSKVESEKREGKTSKVESDKREGKTSKVETEKREGKTSKVESEKRQRDKSVDDLNRREKEKPKNESSKREREKSRDNSKASERRQSKEDTEKHERDKIKKESENPKREKEKNESENREREKLKDDCKARDWKQYKEELERLERKKFKTESEKRDKIKNDIDKGEKEKAKEESAKREREKIIKQSKECERGNSQVESEKRKRKNSSDDSRPSERKKSKGESQKSDSDISMEESKKRKRETSEDNSKTGEGKKYKKEFVNVETEISKEQSKKRKRQMSEDDSKKREIKKTKEQSEKPKAETSEKESNKRKGDTSNDDSGSGETKKHKKESDQQRDKFKQESERRDRGSKEDYRKESPKESTRKRSSDSSNADSSSSKKYKRLEKDRSDKVDDRMRKKSHSDNKKRVDRRTHTPESDSTLKAGRVSSTPHTLMSDVTFTISGYENPRRADVRSTARAMGARYERHWTSGCTHLICAFPNTPKLKEVRALPNGSSYAIVKADWVEECCNLRRRLPWQWHATEPSRRVTRPEDWEEVAGGGDYARGNRDVDSDMDTDDEIELVIKQQNQNKPSTSRHSGHDSPKNETSNQSSPKNGSASTHAKRDKGVKRRCESDGEKTDQNISSRVDIELIDKKVLPSFFDGSVFTVDKSIANSSDVSRLNRYICAYGGLVTKDRDEDTPTEVHYIVGSRRGDPEVETRPSLVTPDWVVRCHDERRKCSTKNY